MSLTKITTVIAACTFTVTALAGCGSSESSENSEAPKESVLPVPTPTVYNDGLADVSDLDNLVTQKDLDSFTWVTLHQKRIPQSKKHGPETVKNGRASEFTQTPQGALLAALHISATSAADAGPRAFDPTIKEQFLGSEKEALLRQTHDEYQEKRKELGLSDGSPLVGSNNASLEAFRFSYYSSERAVIQINLPFPTAYQNEKYTHGEFKMNVQWNDRDWKMIAPKDGQWYKSMSLIKTPTPESGYTMFEGE